MWFGTMSRMSPSPSAFSTLTMWSKPSRPPSTGSISLASVTSYPWVEPLVAVKIGEAYRWLMPRRLR
ncbi:Uncharacterised protein [Mycobacterium tuberculosis]|nr:Uncharacterised protein [Mycobacterium tuberculosis]